MKTCTSVALILLNTLLAWAQPNHGDFIINEILFAPEDSELEFIELLNVSDEPLDVCAYSFSDNRNNISPICDSNRIIQPESFIVLTRNEDVLSAFFPNRPFVTPPDWPALNNSGDTVRLFKRDVLVDEVAYEGSWGQRGYSIERIDPQGPSWGQFNWKPSLSPFKATPGLQNSVFFPDRKPPTVQFAEVQDAEHILVVFDEPINTSLLSTESFRIQQTRPASFEVLTDSTLILQFEQTLFGEFLLTNDLQDFAQNRSTLQSTALAFQPSQGDIIINEIMYEPQTDDFDDLPNQPEYIELMNVSDKYLSLHQLSVIGLEDEKGTADSFRSDVLYPTLAPQQLALIYSNRPADLLSRAFPSSSQSQATLLPIPKASLGLLNTGDYVGITSRDSLIEELTYTPSWHYPDLAITRGVSLERRSQFAFTSDDTNWSSSAHPEGGTPGRSNSILIDVDHPKTGAIVEVAPTPFTPDGDSMNDVLTIKIQPETAPQTVRIRIFDSKGRFVHSLVPAALLGQESVYLWDGNDTDLNQMPTGMYILLIELEDLLHNQKQKIKKIAVLARTR